MQTETQYIEFKSGFNEDVIETLVAFANSRMIFKSKFLTRKLQFIILENYRAT
jgi:hypothetical protein